MAHTDDWGDLGMVIPANPCYADPEPVAGVRQSDHSIYCHGCFSVIPDNSDKGLIASCPNCWAAVVVDRPRRIQGERSRSMPPTVPASGRQRRTEGFDVF